MTLPILVSATPVVESETIVTGRGKKKKERTIVRQIRAGSACALWAWPNESARYRSRRDCLRRKNAVS